MKKQDSLSRLDLSDGDKAELEELKTSLTDSFELRADEFSPSSLVTSSLLAFDSRVANVSSSAPVSPSRASSVSVSSLVKEFERSVIVRTSSTPVLTAKVAHPEGKSLFTLEPSLFLINQSANMSELNESLAPIIKSRSAQKGWVTRAVRTLEGLNTKGVLTLLLFRKQENLINSYFNK